MQVTVQAIGRLKNGPEKDLLARYVTRVESSGRVQSIFPLVINEFSEARGSDAQTRKKQESERLLDACPAGAKIAVLDERGKTISSDDFAKLLTKARDDGVRDFCFLIGGADGHNATMRSRADHVLSFGAATWPHQLLRIMLVEQIYRATTIMAGHPYHKA